MLGTVAEAISALTGAISGLLTPPVDPALAPDVEVSASYTHLSGIGGFVGVNVAPRAELHSRILDAQVIVRVRAASPADLLTVEARAARDLLGADPLLLRSQGVLRLRREVDREDRELAAPDGLGAPAGRELRFAVRFEHRPTPTVAEGTLLSVPPDVTAAMLPPTSRRRYDSEFLTDPMADFTAVDGVGAGTPGTWTWDAANQEIRQTGTRDGGVDGLTGDKSGTYLILRAPVSGGTVSDFVLHAEARSDGNGGIGLVFRFADANNFDFVLLEEPAGVGLFGRRAAGVGALLAQGGQSSGAGFPQGQFLRLRLLAQGGRFELAINEVLALTGQDTAPATPGLVGLFCRNNATARFRHLRLTSL